jgi:AcrR family transcriptional regulator
MRCCFPVTVPARLELTEKMICLSSVHKRYPVRQGGRRGPGLDTLPFVTSNSTQRPLPGRQVLSRDFIARHQRERIINGLALEASERGYHAVTVADVIRRAGVARNTFYENFRSKEECFLAAQQYAMDAALERVIMAAGEIDDWPRRVEAGLAAFLAYIAREPALARTCMVEALAGGTAAMQAHEEALQSFVSLFRLGRAVSPYGEELPETLEEALIGGVFRILYQRLSLAETDQKIEELLPELVEFTLTPYLGAEAARELATNKDRASRGRKVYDQRTA